MALEVNDVNFDDVVLKSGIPVMVDFWAEWCGPCRMISPVMDEISREYEGKVLVVKCNVDNCPVVSGKFSVRSIPTVLYIKNGNVVDKQIGAVSKSDYIKKLTPLLQP